MCLHSIREEEEKNLICSRTQKDQNFDQEPWKKKSEMKVNCGDEDDEDIVDGEIL